MSKTPLTLPQTKQNDKTVQEYSELWRSGFDALEPIRSTWEDKEMVLLSRNPDKLGKSSKSQVNDGRLSTIILERSARVMAQMPSGVVHAMSEKNAGMGQLMNNVIEKFILPNAINPQDHLTKFRMLDMYSQVYGSMPILYDWMVSDAYTGPNSWILSPYNVIYEPGKFTIPESNYVGVRSLVSVKWLKGQRSGDDGKGWSRQGIKYVLDKAEDVGGANPTTRNEYRSFVERNRLPNTPTPTGDNALVEVVTFYERDRWITFCPDFDWIQLRDIDNPHHNGKIPILLKHCFPLMDSMIGLGDVERGMSLQKAMNSLINLYLDGVKFSIFPPVKVIQDQVANAASIIWEPGQKWQVKNQSAIETLQVSPQGMQTFNSTYGFMISALLNQNGTTDTARSAEIDPGMGKTPQALEMQASRESARDSWDRYMMETVIEELYNNYIDLIIRKQTKSIPMYLFKDDIISLRKQYKEDQYLERFERSLFNDIPLNEDEKGGTVKVQPDMLKGGKNAKSEDLKYHFYIDASSTQKKEQAMESAELDKIMEVVLKVGPQSLPNVKTDVLIEKWIKSKGIEGADEIVMTEEEMVQAQQAQAQAMQVDPMTGQPMGPAVPQTTPEGLPAFPGVNAPSQAPTPAPTMQSLGMNAQDPEVMKAIQQMRGLT